MSHLDPVPLLRAGDLLADTGPGQRDPRHQAAQPRHAQPGQPAPAVRIEQREVFMVLIFKMSKQANIIFRLRLAWTCDHKLPDCEMPRKMATPATPQMTRLPREQTVMLS